VTCRLYLISPPAFDPADFAPQLEQALSGGDVAAFQLRMKDTDDEAVLKAGRALKPLCAAHGVTFIVNDRPDLAAALDADGVHVGADDVSVKQARRVMGDDRILGASCYNSRHRAIEAGEAGADYVAFGAFFPTETKAKTVPAEPEILEWWSEIFTLPCVAIGGINAENCAPLVRAGADFLAVSSAVWTHPDGPAAGVAALNAAIAAAHPPASDAL
jgi:thiamine-phosphate pyrophosphorylase